LGLLVHVLNLFLMSQLCFLSDFDIKLSRLLKLLIVVDRSGLERDFQLGIDGFKG
jgi:proteasome lid subunit RPN8/RPN11